MLVLVCASPARADPHADSDMKAGGRDFPTTLTLDEPGIDDELILPTVLYRRGLADGGGATHEIELGAEFEHSITSTTGLFIEDGTVIQDGGKHGAEDFTLGAKWQFLTNVKHETVMSLELARGFGGTGTTHTGANRFGSTTPTIVAGKGFGDLGLRALQPLALTGEFAAIIPDVALRRVGGSDLAATRLTNGNNGVWSAGFSVQYSLPYLARRYPGLRLPWPLAGLTPVCEFAWTSPATVPSAEGTTWIAAPGMLYVSRWGEVGVEALVPLDRAAGSGIGVIGLFQFPLD
jgi:hypothetical protein